MNKKFSTLAVAAMLASAFTAYAGPGDVVTKLAEGNNGKQYQLRAVVDGTEAGYLTLEDHDKALKLTPADELVKIGTSLWCVDVTRENEGKNPIFDFTNKAGKSVLDVTVGGWNVDWDKTTYSGLWVDKNEAHVGGEVRGWEFTPVLGSDAATGGVYMFGSDAKPGTDADAFAAAIDNSTKKVYSLNSYISTTHVATLVWVGDEIKVAVVKADDLNNSALADIQIKFFLQEAYPVNLTAEQFNTILDTQDADEKVKMTFDKDYNNTEVVNPFSTNEFNAEDVDDGTPFVYLFKKDAAEKKSYLRVDTSYVNGFGTKFLGFAFKASNKDNELDETAGSNIEKQYQFRLNYCPTDDSLSIQVKRALYKVNDNNEWWREGLKLDASALADSKEFYAINWTDDVNIDGSESDEDLNNRNWVKLQDLETSTESRIVTVGDAPINTHISFGYGTCAEVASAYTSVADGVYYIKNSKGQYLAHPIYNNGTNKPLFVTVNADEQEVAHMPAYQWVVLKKYTNTAASKATSPVMIANREFDADFEYDGVQLMQNEGAQYMSVNSPMMSTSKWGWDANNDGVIDTYPEVLSDKDSIEFVAVPATSVKDQYLGYKKIDADSLLVNKYTFNYWHPYADDKFIAKSDKDSTLTVLNGEQRAFGVSELDAILGVTSEGIEAGTQYSTIDIKYGYGKDMTEDDFKDIQKRIPNLAQLVRTVYKVDLNGIGWKVNDNDQFNLGADYSATKAPWVYDVQNEVHYYAFFKENNHINGNDYYAIVRAQSVYEDNDVYYFDSARAPFVIASNKAGVSDYDGAATLKNQPLWETRTSAFAIERDNTPLYRRFNSTLEGQAGDGVDTLRFYEKYRNEYLMIEANPNFMVEHIDFLGIDAQDKAQGGLAFIVDTAWVNRGAGNIKPQYLISIDRHDLAGTPGVPCTYEHNHYDNQGNAVDAAHCSHAIPATPGFARGKYLINFHNVARYDKWANNLNSVDESAYRWNKYDRAGFKEAIVYNDTLWILRDEFKNLKNEEIDFEALRKAENEALNKWVKEYKTYYGTEAKAAAAYPSYIYDLTGDNHKYATWSMRFFDRSVAANEVEADRAFLFESMKSYHWNAPYSYDIPYSLDDPEGDIAPDYAAWLKMQNGCLVLSTEDSNFSDITTGNDDALIFNVEHVDGDQVAVDNENIAVEGVSVVAGNGQVTIMGAAGKNVTITNILGKVVASQVIASDNATIAVPAGIVAVAVEGEAAVKAIVK